MLLFIAALVSALLCRCPRGGPGGDVWKRWIGFAPGSTVAALTWAVVSAVLIVLAAGAPLWLIPAFALAMFLGELVPYMRGVSEAGVKVWYVSLCGCALLNPLMGPIYWLAYRYKARLTNRGPLLDGWTAYAEFGWGLITAVSYSLIAWWIA